MLFLFKDKIFKRKHCRGLLPKVPTDEWCDTTADAMKILLLATKNASFRKANAKIGHFYEIG